MIVSGNPTSSLGSSPQVRGIFTQADLAKILRGIIPAGAGHLRWRAGVSRKQRDHPRRCGAFLEPRRFRPLCRGSSPQVRGIYEMRFVFFGGFGIIPAGAGHLAECLRVRARSGDHPRRCGAFFAPTEPVLPLVGSSPQVRGI